MKTVAYLAGPMSGIAAYNFPAFDEARDTLIARGYEVISPADLDRAVGFDPDTCTVDKEFLDAAMERDIAAIMQVDCIVMLPGWEKSTGALAELALARWRHIPAYEWPSMVEIPKTPVATGDPKAKAGSVKCPMYLLPPEALEKTAWVHGLGARKYSTSIPIIGCQWEDKLASFCTCHESYTEQHYVTLKEDTLHTGFVLSATVQSTIASTSEQRAIHTESTGLKVNANPATISSCGKVTLTTQRGSEKSVTIGANKTVIISKNTERNTGVVPDQKGGFGQPYAQANSDFMGCVSKMKSESCRNKVEGAPYAEDQRGDQGCSTSTMITKQERSGVSCVIGATKDSGFSGTLSRLLRKHSPTCDIQKFVLSGENLFLNGAFNWRRTGVELTTYISAIMRHLMAIHKGEWIDPESGQPHAAHIAASCNILMDADHHGKLSLPKPIPTP